MLEKPPFIWAPTLPNVAPGLEVCNVLSHEMPNLTPLPQTLQAMEQL